MNEGFGFRVHVGLREGRDGRRRAFERAGPTGGEEHGGFSAVSVTFPFSFLECG